MGRKVFISFLGTSNYLETYYSLNGEKTPRPVRFIQEALVDFLCKKWTEKDAIIIFKTEASERSNWLDNGHEKISKEIERKGLRNILIEKRLTPQLVEEDTNVPDGFSEKEIWKIFEKVYHKLEDEDEIYFDVTHAFRSIPLFSSVLFNFSQFMKRTKLISIHYGAFEKLGPIHLLKEKPLEERIAPIIDLTDLIVLQEMTSVASNFVEFGKIGRIGEILSNPTTSDSGLTMKQKNRIVEAINNLKKNVNLLDSYISANRMTDIKNGKYVIEIIQNLDIVLRNDLPVAERLILEKLKDEIQQFVPEVSDNNIAAAIDWAYKYKMLAQAYTLAQEYLLSLACNKLEALNPFEEGKGQEKEYRKYISAILGMNQRDVEDCCYKGDVGKYKELSEKLLSVEWIKQLRKEYKLIADNRNTINHAKGTITAEDLELQFYSSYQKSLTCLKEIQPC
jgi:CRISPR-associated Csx2 family protein